jgi:hypothetical protein
VDSYPQPVDRETLFTATANERRRVADLIADLDDAQLATPSLCAGWDVKTVAAHLVSTLTDGLPGFCGKPCAVAALLAPLISLLGVMQNAQLLISPLTCADLPTSGGVHRPMDRAIRWQTCWYTAATSGFPLA